MSDLLKIVSIVIVLAGIVIGLLFFLQRDEDTPVSLRGSGTATQGAYETNYMLLSTSTATARSDSFAIGGARKVTFLIGEVFHTGQDTGTYATPSEYVFQVGDEAEDNQGVTRYSTTTTLTTDFLTRTWGVLFSTSTPFNSTAGGTTTVSLDIQNNTFPFVRVVRTGTADVATATVVIVREY